MIIICVHKEKKFISIKLIAQQKSRANPVIEVFFKFRYFVQKKIDTKYSKYCVQIAY